MKIPDNRLSTVLTVHKNTHVYKHRVSQKYIHTSDVNNTYKSINSVIIFCSDIL
jgi:hypothetical protein